jgi:hypothetical protein
VKKLIALLAVVGLSGCVYAPPYGSAGGYYGNSPYYSGSPYYGTPYYGPSVSIYGGSGWTAPHRYSRDRDRDGVPNWRDRDRDGVPNRRDAYPNDPWRR